MLCSFLIPTRHRVNGLFAAIQSMHTSADPSNFDVHIRIDDDDSQTLSERDALAALYPNVHPIIGPRHSGYRSVGQFIAELAANSSAQWVSMLDDDVTLEGHRWDLKLASLPLSGIIAVPEFYTLGKSRYPSGSCKASAYLTGWFAPRTSLPHPIASPVDRWIYSTMIKQRSWSVATLQGVTYNHQRHPSASLHDSSHH